MSMTTSVASSLPVPSRPTGAPPGAGALAWMKENLFATWVSTAVTLGLGYIIVRVLLAFAEWALIGAVWSVAKQLFDVHQPLAYLSCAAVAIVIGLGFSFLCHHFVERPFFAAGSKRNQAVPVT